MPNLKLTLVGLSAAVALGLAGCATTDTAATTAPAAEASTAVAKTDTTKVADAAEGDAKVTCKYEAVVGSKFKKKICGTVADWERMEEASRQSTRNMQDGPRGTSGN